MPHAVLEPAPPQPRREEHAALRPEIVAGQNDVHAEVDEDARDLQVELEHHVQERLDVVGAGGQVHQELLQADQVPGVLEDGQLDHADYGVVGAEAGDDLAGQVEPAGRVRVGKAVAGQVAG